MSEDNIVSFPGVEKPVGPEPEKRVSADQILEAAMGKYDDVILIGLGLKKSQCVSTVAIQDAIYELSRAIYKLHIYMDTQPRG